MGFGYLGKLCLGPLFLKMFERAVTIFHELYDNIQYTGRGSGFMGQFVLQHPSKHFWVLKTFERKRLPKVKK